MKLSIIIPAHNEQARIKRTLEAYTSFFKEKTELQTEFVVVLNGCTDNTFQIVHDVQTQSKNIISIDMPQAGKGLAIKAGFADALTRENDMIGFVDADMATEPQYFYDLLSYLDEYDGAIASRYMPGAVVTPQRPALKEWGRRIVYQPLVWSLFGLNLYDYQCGAKVFQRKIIEKITPELTVCQWAFDVELLYLCKKYEFTINEVPTVWHDQVDSKLSYRAGSRMLSSLVKLRWRHSWIYATLFGKE